MKAEHTLNALMRLSYSCSRVRSFLGDADEAGLKLAITGYNRNREQLEGLLDDEATRIEMLTLCPALDLNAGGVSLAYAGLEGWIDGFIQSDGMNLVITEAAGEPHDAKPQLLGEASTGHYL